MFGSHLRSPYDFHLIEQSSPPPVLLEVHLEGGGGLVGSACPLEVLQTVFNRVGRDIGCQISPGTGGFHLSQIDDIHQLLGLQGMRQAALIAQFDHVVFFPRYVSRMIASSSLQSSPVVASSVFVGHLVRLTPVHYAVWHRMLLEGLPAIPDGSRCSAGHQFQMFGCSIHVRYLCVCQTLLETLAIRLLCLEGHVKCFESLNLDGVHSPPVERSRLDSPSTQTELDRLDYPRKIPHVDLHLIVYRIGFGPVHQTFPGLWRVSILAILFGSVVISIRISLCYCIFLRSTPALEKLVNLRPVWMTFIASRTLISVNSTIISVLRTLNPTISLRQPTAFCDIVIAFSLNSEFRRRHRNFYLYVNCFHWMSQTDWHPIFESFY